MRKQTVPERHRRDQGSQDCRLTPKLFDTFKEYRIPLRASVKLVQQDVILLEVLGESIGGRRVEQFLLVAKDAAQQRH